MIRTFTEKPVMKCVRKKGEGREGREGSESSETVRLLSDELGLLSEKMETVLRSMEDKDEYIKKLEQNIVDLIEFDKREKASEKGVKNGSIKKRKKNEDQ